MAVVALHGFSSGIPLALTAGTLQAWMVGEKVDLTVIGIYSLVGMPYALKFLWSPLMDHYVPPILGRRRGWILVCQIALMLAIVAMAFSKPAASPMVLALLAFLVAFISASQDIVVDAYRTEILAQEEFGAGAGVYMTGYRIAMIISGSISLMMASKMSWKAVYIVMALTILIGIVATLLAPEPAVPTKAPKSLSEAFVLPLVEYLKRKGALEMLTFVLIYKLDVVVAMAMTTPFLLQLGFTTFDVGAVNKGVGLFATIVGALAGGAMMSKIGLKRSLWAFGILQGVSGFAFMTLARLGHHYPMMVTSIIAANFCGGLGTAAFSAFMMSLCDKRFTATQFALITSLMAVSRVFVSAPTGWLAKNVGWETYFLISILIAIPGLLLLLRYDKWHKLKAEQNQASPAAEPA
jgi:PAT family beta-lactamase induction signal transducer AmpG